MSKIKKGMCVKIPDGRIGRVRDYSARKWRVRVKRTTSNSHVFMRFNSADLIIVDCPPGWMSVDGYNNYIKKTVKN